MPRVEEIKTALFVLQCSNKNALSLSLSLSLSLVDEKSKRLKMQITGLLLSLQFSIPHFYLKQISSEILFRVVWCRITFLNGH